MEFFEMGEMVLLLLNLLVEWRRSKVVIVVQ